MHTLVLLLYFTTVLILSSATIDINLPEYQYLANHLTHEECHQLVAALHFKSYDLPKELNTAERKLPRDIPCIDLLLHWNSTPKEGKGGTHIEVCHRLNQIGREDLAQWLSKTVFHEISMDLLMEMVISEEAPSTERPKKNESELYLDQEVSENAVWGELDSIVLTLLLLGLLFLIFGFFFLCCLCCRRKPKEKFGYNELSTNEH